MTSPPLVDQTEYGFVLRDGSDAMLGVERRAALVGPEAWLESMFQ
jgi:hypothetical protein